MTKAEASLDALQQKLHERGSQESSLNERYRRAQASFERLNSTAMVVREKQHGFLSEAERLTRFVEEGRVRRSAAEKELAEAQSAAETAKLAHEQAQVQLQKLEAQHKSHTSERNALRKQVDTLMAQQRSLTHRQETIQATQEALRENLSEKRARAQVIDAHVADAKQRQEAAQAQSRELQKVAQELSEQYKAAQEKDTQARERLNALVVKRDQLRKSLDEARQAYTRASAECAALEELERASESANPLLGELLNQREQLAPSAQLFTHAVTAPDELDSLVELLLGEDIRALVANDANQTRDLAICALSSDVYGSVSLIGGGQNLATSPHAPQLPRLIDRLEVTPSFAPQIEALLGDVYIVSSLTEALEARKTYQGDFRFACLEGCVVTNRGTILVAHRSEEEQKNSALARRRALEKARKTEQETAQCYEEVQSENEALETELRSAQTESLTYSEALANLKGRSESATRDAEQSAQNLEALSHELERMIREQQENEAFLAKAQPDSDELEKELSQVLAKLAVNKDEVAKIEQTLSPLRRSIVSLSEKLSDARLEAARLSERYAYAQRMEQTRRQEINSSAREDEASNRRIAVARGAAYRADALLSTLASLADAASLVSVRLEQESHDEAQLSRELHDQIAEATRVSREVRERFEGFNTRLGDVRIEKGRLEIQVDAGIKAIVEDCATPLEQALSLDPLENRTNAEERAGSLERRIKNMGTINPDAAEEFEEVNERYQYLSAQLEDMRLARKSLARIVNVIDERMKNDFIETFEQVNANFSEIFSTLFPGGQAHLSLVDPEDLEHTGVDVNAQPVGKRVKKMSLLSGGEKSMTAMALLFAVYRIRQTPFYILDEVEAALDDTNLRRLIAYLDVIRDQTQFIMITHQRRTMESADILYGVSMQADGITKVVSQKLDNAQRKEG